MEMKRIKALADLMGEMGLTHLELNEGEDRLVLKKGMPHPWQTSSAPDGPTVFFTDPATTLTPASAPRPAEPAGTALTAPLVGCVYLSPSPDDAPFVKVGDAVKKGQVLCILEAMKVMNDFPAPQDGVIAEVCVENGQLVEYGQPLFRFQ